MRVFVTGATGFIGGAVVRELQANGHQVLGLTRSDSGAQRLQAAGVEVYRGSIDEPESLRAGASAADGVIHTAFDHSNLGALSAAAVKDLAVVQALGEELAGSGKPFVTTYGTTAIRPGAVLTEDVRPFPLEGRGLVEAQTLQWAEKDVRAISVRPSTVVHGPGVMGFVHFLIAAAKEKGFSAYPGGGSNRWPAVNAAALYRLALENAPAGSVVHAVQDAGVTSGQIAEAIGHGLNLPVRPIPVEQAADHFGWLGPLFGLDIPASSQATQDLLAWRPVRPGLLENLREAQFFA
ncbi:putative NAD-dependent epimerase/dehydratase [Kineosporia sp. NBRC 101677]|uniref:SDR family oxidoreductase n=1 Tax=Kineosporia sp. NBRC 101677 TaxID=3032197 RepID=UPI0024A35D4A|nr:SDR family oxidoreductase [Kineosporia sp. NBRC 101677]GLY19684.1 putative NAD-dependent epimerase/dehydratase [Kineosporia sp. NBRC 101677]